MARIDKDQAVLHELQGFLDPFAWFNDKTDHVYSFTLECRPKSSSLDETLVSLFEGKVRTARVTPIPDWHPVVRDLFKRWLFEFQDKAGAHLEDARGSFSLSDESFRSDLVDRLVAKLEVIVSPCRTWRVNLDVSEFYECAWDDVAFEQEAAVYFLHLGVSD